ncbi:hypothetical protein CONPUDRAFT_165109 [Coniophora puteana RWD-64-598 SS2]|uniref:Uncharacterized protein n=1 Tax=Coniophora puteana (strain RWD-64-598) TaxID=741705 RepID=A0A5M3MU02_CONPW|nr:uncharacterized protein CONPUDRAFT_165109 [Coniophora puteana RWD-64-598 SS2]EIW82527.1 hypothetical protein CONPUDRAFT_165109 [Coniophora puteana RWD-64-598 SS2]
MEDGQAKISAYYSLVFPNITFFLQTLAVTIGRRAIPTTTPSSSADTLQTQVDVDLGPLKSVSRLHAKIEYEETSQRFVLVVMGRNGAWVDGVWSPSGSRVPLSQRSQIQIASRTFHFVLPPPPPQELSPSPSSPSSPRRARSPSVDITSVDVTDISPPSSIPPHSPPQLPVDKPPVKAEPKVEPRSPPPQVSKKRKKMHTELPPPPAVMPPKPQLTYAQLCYRAIKAMGGKATLHDICTWMIDNYDWYRYNQGQGWENSVRHNLSSGRAFKKMERSSGERGKGFYWSVDEQFEHTFEEQAEGAPKVKKEKVPPLDPPLKRAAKSGPLPPPLTNTPLPLKSPFSTTPLPPPGQVIVKQEPAAPPTLASAMAAAAASTSVVLASVTPPAPGATGPANPANSVSTTTASTPTLQPLHSPPPPASTPSLALPASVTLPIVVGPLPPSHPQAQASNPQPIVLHNNSLILSPAIFSHLTPEQLKELEALGAQKALEILQGHIVRYLKEKMRSGRGRGRGRRGAAGGAAGRGGKGGGERGDGRLSEATNDGKQGSPFTNVPLPPRTDSTAPTKFALSAGKTGETSTSANASTAAALDAPPARSESPIIVVDDDDDLDMHSAKRPRLEGEGEPLSIV